MPDQHQLRRAVLQRLQSLQHAGVLDLPRTKRVWRRAEDAAASRPNGAPGISSAEPSPPETEEGFLLHNNPARRGQPSHDTTAGASQELAKWGPPLSRDQRIAALADLCRDVAACSRCQELASTRTQTVFGVGDPMARLVFLGEAPGADEDRQGEPFVGRAGQLLTKIIEACTLRREDVYILNILKCRPPGNRNPQPDEAANCREHLQRQLGIIQPEFICCLGAVAVQNLLETTTSIGKLRGRIHRWGKINVVATYHPAYLLRNPSAKRATWDDMKMLMTAMGIEVSGR